MFFSFKMVGFEQLTKKLSGNLTKSPIQDGIKKLTLFIEREAKKGTPVDTGALRASINSKYGEFIGIVGTQQKYAPFVEYGTKPHWAPFRAFEGWAGRHGISEAAVWWSVGIKGTKAHHMFQKAMDKANDRIGDFIKDVGNAISVRWNS